MPLLPFFHARGAQLIVRMLAALSADVDHHRWPKESLHGDLIDSRLAGREMRRRIQMRAIVLQHPEAAREVAVFLDAGVDLGLKEFFIPGPRHQFVVDRVAQVEHPGLPGRNSLKHRIVAHILYEERGKGSQANDKETGAANDSHLSPQFNFRQTALRVTDQGNGISGVATIPAMRRISCYSRSV